MHKSLKIALGVVLKAAVSEESQCAVNSSSSDSSEQRVDNSEPETAATAELDDVRQQQTALLASLQQAQSKQETYNVHVQCIYACTDTFVYMLMYA